MSYCGFVRREYERKERVWKKNLYDIEQEKAGLMVRYDKAIKDYENLNTRYLAAEKKRKEVRGLKRGGGM